MPCRCGDTIIANAFLTGDLGPCTGHGLIIKSGVELDCRGHVIQGSGGISEQFGVHIEGARDAEVRGATVKACRISGFRRGIRLRGASSSLIADNTTTGNGNFQTHEGYGIDVSGGSHNNIFQANRVERNADEGIHVGTGSHKNRFVDNTSRDNHREALYLLAADGNVFIGNTLGGGGVNSLYLKDSSSNLFERNTFVARTARIIGTARDNRFIDNTFSGAGLHFAPYKGDPSRAPTNNVVIGGSITGTRECVRFTSSRGNVVADAAFGDCRTAVRAESPSGPSENGVIGPAPATVEVDNASSLDLGRRVSIEVRDADGAAVRDAEVQAVDATGKALFTAATDDKGSTAPQVIITATLKGSQTIGRTPIRITVTKPGFAPETRTLGTVDEARLAVTIRPSADSLPASSPRSN